LQTETESVRRALETAIAEARPLFGEETGEFIDFTGACTRLRGFQITEVKPPRVGQSHPSAVHGILRVSCSDQEWVARIGKGTPLYLVGFEQDATATGFRKEFGVKLVRQILVREASLRTVAEGEYEVKVEIDPVQYKEDLEGIVVTRAKFIEDIYSNDCHLVLHLEELRTHGDKLLTLRKLREGSSNI